MHLPGVKWMNPGNYLDQARLSRTVVTKQSYDFILAHFKIDTP